MANAVVFNNPGIIARISNYVAEAFLSPFHEAIGDNHEEVAETECNEAVGAGCGCPGSRPRCDEDVKR